VLYIKSHSFMVMCTVWRWCR